MLLSPGSGTALPAVVAAATVLGVFAASSITTAHTPAVTLDPHDRTGSESAATPWVWPTGTRVVERGWEPPSDDYAAGHRGIDVPAALGTLTGAVDDGTVAFAGAVGGRTVVTVDHGDGLVSTLDSVQPLVAAGDAVRQGEPVGRVSVGHCPAVTPCLHVGARVDGRYVDPTRYLPPAEWPVLLPESAWPG